MATGNQWRKFLVFLKNLHILVPQKEPPRTTILKKKLELIDEKNNEQNNVIAKELEAELIIRDRKLDRPFLKRSTLE